MDEREQGREAGTQVESTEETTALRVMGPQPTRRQFLGGALAVSGLAWSGLLEAAEKPAAAAAAAPVQTDPLRIGVIERTGDGKLRGVISIKSGQRTLPGGGGAIPLRFLEGKNSAGQVVWPPRGDARALPGPTLRARVGDQVELTFLNHVDTSQFGATLDRVELGLDAGCQRVVGQTGTELYPGTTTNTAQDEAPNCFHGSSTSNLHFHGTHVTPDGLGDNVLLQLRADPSVTEQSVQNDFDLIFRAGPPDEWSDLPRSWRDRQLALLRQYDATAPWNGRNPTPGNPVLPPEFRLLPPTLALTERGMWPQYQIGAYPYCFRLTEYTEDAQGRPTGPAMGQAPGTHWYHAHKHGSTAINVYNGLAGAFIIEGEYDRALKAAIPGLVEQVLLVQNLAETPTLTRATGSNTGKVLYVNGLSTPTITMRPGEVQLWRLINASVRSVTTIREWTPDGTTTGPLPEMRQTAQDGVQFCWENFRDQPRLTGGPTDPSRANAFAAGNRVDLLVKAPSQAGTWNFNLADTTQNATRLIPIFKLQVSGTPVAGMNFPTQAQYPVFPKFLRDLDPRQIRISRKLDFGWEPGRSQAFLSSTGRAPQFNIDGEQFSGDQYDQTMVLGDVEEWTLINTTSQIAHPFHIHVNPFQVVEIYDPATNTTYAPTGNYLWQDVIAIPPSVLDSNGNVVGRPGSVKIRSSFVDFPGSFVLHCHMLAHEDRGMMQLVRVISPRMDVPHH